MNNDTNRSRPSLGLPFLCASGVALVALAVAHVKLSAAPPQPGAPALPADRPTTGPSTRPVDPNKIVLTAGDCKMTAADFEALVSTLPPEMQQTARGPAKRRLAEELVKLKVLAAEAKKQGLDQTPKFKQRLELMRDEALVGALHEKLQETLLSDEELKKHYDANKGKYEKVTARHILISTAPDKGMTDAQAKAKADDLKKQLDKGADFAALAKANSADPGSASKGGELPALPRGQLVSEFEDVAFSQALNAISQPVKTRFGYHIIQTTKKEVSPFEEVKGEIADQLRTSRIDQAVEDLRKKAETQIDESYFGAAPTTRRTFQGLPAAGGE